MADRKSESRKKHSRWHLGQNIPIVGTRARRDRLKARNQRQKNRTDVRANRSAARIGVRGDRVKAKEKSGYYSADAVAARSAAWGKGAEAAASVASSVWGDGSAGMTSPAPSSSSSTTSGLPSWAPIAGLAAGAVLLYVLTKPKK